MIAPFQGKCHHCGSTNESRNGFLSRIAPRSPAQPDASELLRRAREQINDGLNQFGVPMRGNKLIEDIDAFLRGGSGG